MEGVIGPVQSFENETACQDFTYSDVTELGPGGVPVKECFGQLCDKIASVIDEGTLLDGGTKKYLAICVPCYNESMDDLMKTVVSIMENIDFMKNSARFHNDASGVAIKREFDELEPVIVPIFDGMNSGQMHDSIRTWLAGDMPGVLDDLPGPDSHAQKDKKIDPNRLEVRVAVQQWWYYCLSNGSGNQEGVGRGWGRESTRGSNIGIGAGGGGGDGESEPAETAGEEDKLTQTSYMHFHMVPILKRTNHRKHNSHHWFFQGICCALSTKLVFLTDCSTSFDSVCLARLAYDLVLREDLIGVTARQRVEGPNPNFRPCEHTLIPFLKHKDEHKKPGSKPCWKCFLAYYFSPAPVQAFEFEATLVMNYSLFNLVEALPVLPGPCQLLDWEKLKKYNVIEAYFELLFSGDDVSQGISRANHRRLPREYCQSAHIDPESSSASAPLYERPEGEAAVPQAKAQAQAQGGRAKVRPSGILSSVFGDVEVETEVDEEVGGAGGVELKNTSSRTTTLATTTAPFHQAPQPPFMSSITEDQEDQEEDAQEQEQEQEQEQHIPSFTAVKLKEKYKHTRRHSTFRIVATESTKPKRLNIRGASAAVQNSKSSSLDMTEFLRLHMRLAEDRVLSFVTVFCTGYGTKWIPGATFYYEPEVSFDMYLKQRRRWLNGTAASFLFFFSSKKAKLTALGGFFDTHKAGKSARIVMMLWSLYVLQFVIVLVLPAIVGILLYKSALISIPHGDSHVVELFGDTYLNVAGIITTVYAVIYAAWVHNSFYRHPSEVLSFFAFLLGAVITGIIWGSAIIVLSRSSSSELIILLCFYMGAPMVISGIQSCTAAMNYLLLLPWFFAFGVFVTVFLPAYSWARLHDTTWGNRQTGEDAALNTLKLKKMKSYVWVFNFFLVLMNCVLMLIFCVWISNEVFAAISVLLALPTGVQMIGALFYLLVILPCRGHLVKRNQPSNF